MYTHMYIKKKSHKQLSISAVRGFSFLFHSPLPYCPPALPPPPPPPPDSLSHPPHPPCFLSLPSSLPHPFFTLLYILKIFLSS